MKDLDLQVLFCEVLSGVCLIVIVAGALDLGHVVNLKMELASLLTALSGWTLAGILLIAYIAGIVIDAVGMAFDQVFVGRIGLLQKALRYADGSLPDRFYANAKPHQLAYWLDQWTYFSCYRNLLMMSPGWVIVSIAVASKYGGFHWAVILGGLCLITVVSLAVTIGTLQAALVNISKV